MRIFCHYPFMTPFINKFCKIELSQTRLCLNYDTCYPEMPEYQYLRKMISSPFQRPSETPSEKLPFAFSDAIIGVGKLHFDPEQKVARSFSALIAHQFYAIIYPDKSLL